MEHMEIFIDGLKNNRYTAVQSVMSQAQAEFIKVLKCIGSNIGSTSYSSLRTAMNMLESGDFRSLLKYKEPAIEEYDALHNEYQMYLNIQKEKSERQSKTYKDKRDRPMADIIREQNEELDILRNRLNRISGNHADGNSTYGDFLDPRNPKKLAKQFAELYEIEFKEAYQDVAGTSGMEALAMKKLNDILEKANEFTKKSSDKQVSDLMASLMLQTNNKIETTGNIQEDLNRRARNIQKENAHFALPSLNRDFMNDNKLSSERSQALKAFASKCLELTWYFNVQHPRLYLEWEPKGKEIGKHLSVYLKSGNRIDFQVWPTLYLHKDGPLLQKGIVQPK